ncbi:transposase [Myxococcus faecalis]|uniref:IS701 family transposase n=1 Tax=Myxococcus faecalis TaxID=3115646 RepID=UPI003CE801B8
MAASHLYALLRVLQLVRPAFTEPSFLRFLVLFAGWVCSGGTHAVTEALVAAGVSGVQHHAAFHRFFSRTRWSTDEVGRLLLLKLAALGPVRLVLDDTLCSHKGPKVFGLGSHLDAVRSTRAMRVFCFGHVWVTLAVLVHVPFAARPWALPVLFRLYRTQAECQRRDIRHRKKTQLGRELVERVLSWLPTGPLELAADEAYSCSTLLKGLPQRLVFVGAMRPDAVLTRPRVHRCRSRKTGRWLTRDVPVPKPEALARDSALPWMRLTAQLYGRSQQVDYKEVVARWRSAAGERMLKVVVVRMTSGSRPLRVFFCTAPSLSALEVVERYAFRWSIEVLFRDLKQLLGFADSRARRRLAVLRTAPFAGLSYTLLVLWYLELTANWQQLRVPLRPWYTTKTTVSFADVLRLAQSSLARARWHSPRRLRANLRAASRAPPSQESAE